MGYPLGPHLVLQPIPELLMCHPFLDPQANSLQQKRFNLTTMSDDHKRDTQCWDDVSRGTSSSHQKGANLHPTPQGHMRQAP
ncbi:hypothetical protein QOT17_003165 [Balamuthia mandrillaris]